MREALTFDCAGSRCWATLDAAPGSTGLLIVSGGNELRMGSHRGMAKLSQDLATQGFPVFRFDRRGVGDSEGDNAGFESSAPDIAAALATFRAAQPQLKRVIAFGNCDAASALLLHPSLEVDALILANPWTIEPSDDDDTPPPAVVRAYYAKRLRDPRAWLKLLRGGVNLRDTRTSLKAAARADAPSPLAERLAAALQKHDLPISILLASQDGTAIAFDAAWGSPTFAAVRHRGHITRHASASHSFAVPADYTVLRAHILKALTPPA